MTSSSVQPVWEAEHSVRSLYNSTYLLRQERNFAFGLRNLSNISERFYEKALDCNYQSMLSVAQQFDLRNIVSKLGDWIRCEDQQCRMEPCHVTTLQICLLKCIRYALLKTTHQVIDVFYSVNAYRLAVMAAAVCYDSNDFHKMSWCLKEAAFLRQHVLTMPLNSVEAKASLILSDNMLFVLRVLCTRNSSSHESLGSCLQSLYYMELNYSETEFLTRVMWNISLEIVKDGKFLEAMNSLKLAYNLGNQLREPKRCETVTKVLSLMAFCLIQSGRKDNVSLIPCNIFGKVNGISEVKFRLAVFAKSEPRKLVDLFKSWMHELERRYDGKMDELRGCILKSLKVLENHSSAHIMAKVMEELHCFDKLREAAISSTSDNSDLWIWAEVGLRLCFNQRYVYGAYEILNLLAMLPFSSSVNIKSARCILCLAERAVVSMQSSKEAFKWYVALLRIRQHIISKGYQELTILDNAIRCCISYGSPESLDYINCLLEQKDFSYRFNFQHARRLLLVTILRAEKPKAFEVWSRLDMKYKSVDSVDDEWDEALTTLEHCVTASSVIQDFEGITINCLNAIAFEEKLRSWSSALVVRVIRFHLGIIFSGGLKNSPIAAKSIDNLISILISSYLTGKEATVLMSGKLHDGMDLWFGNLAWYLAQKVAWLRPFQRHQLFKLSYKSLKLIQDRDSSIDQRILDAILLSVAAGINSFDDRQASYSNTLQRCLEIIGDYGCERDRTKLLVLRLYEFFILCQIGNFTSISQFVERCAQDSSYGNQFFEYLSLLASPRFDKFLCLIMPTTERSIISSTTLRRIRTLKSQTKLNVIAVACLKISIDKMLKEKSTLTSLTVTLAMEKWKKAITILSDCFTSCKETEEHLFKLLRDYKCFAKMTLEKNHQIEVNAEVFNFCCNTVMEMKMCKPSEDVDRWVELLEGLGSLTEETQKVLRMFKREHLFSLEAANPRPA